MLANDEFGRNALRGYVNKVQSESHAGYRLSRWFAHEVRQQRMHGNHAIRFRYSLG